ncbi:hypothetical protein [Paenibacillus sp. N3.4]|uniref:hypothetical protein n=1 Tax=Paenibacillus sp. N3.4 TaxID=2603222 RepID=UPI0028FCB295|nr:hypothetical protein [Paenibacillus sp. N3.4]
MDDLNLGAKYREAGISITNFIGVGLVSFRMYPSGIQSAIQGFGKGAVLSTSTLSPGTITLIAIWVVGLIASETALLFTNTSWAMPLFIGYLLYMLQFFYFVRYIGRFGFFMPILHFFSALFFIIVMLYSIYQVVFLRKVSWKGRHIHVGGKRNL